MNHQPRNDARTMCALLIIAALLACIALGWVLGFRDSASRVHAMCDSGETFYRLGEVATPYRCTRIIDYPPTTGAPE